VSSIRGKVEFLTDIKLGIACEFQQPILHFVRKTVENQPSWLEVMKRGRKLCYHFRDDKCIFRESRGFCLTEEVRHMEVSCKNFCGRKS
jgi:hypothetical protein